MPLLDKYELVYYTSYLYHYILYKNVLRHSIVQDGLLEFVLHVDYISKAVS